MSTVSRRNETSLGSWRPKDSVVDSFQRCWDHPNLYAAGCGSLPSIGTSNPSLTMAALALRSAEQIHRDLVELHRPVEPQGSRETLLKVDNGE